MLPPGGRALCPTTCCTTPVTLDALPRNQGSDPMKKFDKFLEEGTRLIHTAAGPRRYRSSNSLPKKNHRVGRLSRFCSSGLHNRAAGKTIHTVLSGQIRSIFLRRTSPASWPCFNQDQSVRAQGKLQPSSLQAYLFRRGQRCFAV